MYLKLYIGLLFICLRGRVIPKTQKVILDVSLLNTQHYKIWIKGKWSNPGNGVESFPTPWYSSYWKGSLWVILDFSRLTIYNVNLYFLVIYNSRDFKHINNTNKNIHSWNISIYMLHSNIHVHYIFVFQEFLTTFFSCFLQIVWIYATIRLWGKSYSVRL